MSLPAGPLTRCVAVATLGLACAREAPPSEAGGAADTVVTPAPAPALEARCYRSPRSILFGPPTARGQQGHAPGWIRLEGVSQTDSASGELVDANRSGLGARWRRHSADTVRLLGADDFLRVELWLAVTDDSASGRGEAHSDAAAERDATGRLVDLRRSWRLSAVRAPCDSMPTRPGPGGV
jgi:hypothetical protein